MPIFTNTTFKGHYPVGTAAVVSARNAEDAALMLNGYLAGVGLPQTEFVKAEDMKPFDKKPDVRILCDGDY